MTMARRPMTDAERHEHQHRLYATRLAAFQAEPKNRRHQRRQRRREAWKRAAWTLRGHLTGQHGQGHLRPFASLDDLEALHDRLHAEEPTP